MKRNEPEVRPLLDCLASRQYETLLELFSVFRIPYAAWFNLFVLLCLEWAKRANCSIPGQRLATLENLGAAAFHWPQPNSPEQEICECKTDKTHFQIVRRLRDFRENNLECVGWGGTFDGQKCNESFSRVGQGDGWSRAFPLIRKMVKRVYTFLEFLSSFIQGTEIKLWLIIYDFSALDSVFNNLFLLTHPPNKIHKYLISNSTIGHGLIAFHNFPIPSHPAPIVN